MTSLLYWVNVALWAPSVFVLFVGTLEVFWGRHEPPWEEIIVIALIWVMVGIGVLPIVLSKWVPNPSAAFKMIVLVALGAIGVAFAIKNGTANSFAPREWKPAWGSSYSFLPIIIYSYMGFELMNSAGAAIKNPKRDVPKMIILAGVVILGVYMFSTFGILASLKTKTEHRHRHRRRDEAVVQQRARRLHLALRHLHGRAALHVPGQHGDLVARREPDHGLDRAGQDGAWGLRARQQAVPHPRLRLRAHGRRRNGPDAHQLRALPHQRRSSGRSSPSRRSSSCCPTC